MASIDKSEVGIGDKHTEKADNNPANGHNARSTSIEAILKEAVTGSVSAHTPTKWSFLARHTSLSQSPRSCRINAVSILLQLGLNAKQSFDVVALGTRLRDGTAYNDGKRYTKVMQHRPVPLQLLLVSQFR